MAGFRGEEPIASRSQAEGEYRRHGAVVSVGLVEQGAKFGVEFGNTWSCYKGEEVHCGKCPTCLSRKEAFLLNGLADPTEYGE